MIVLSRLHPESISALSWNGATLVRNFTSIDNSAFPDRSTSFSMAQFRSQKKSNFPFRLFAANLRVWSDKQRFEGDILGICPSRRFAERSKYLRRGSSNKYVGMLPFSRLDPRCSSREFLSVPVRSIGICTWRRFSERSKYWRLGSSNKEAGMLPLNWLCSRCSSRKFLRFVEGSIFGMCPWRSLYWRSKYWRQGCSNKEAGMLPLNWLNPRRKSCKFLRFVEGSIFFSMVQFQKKKKKNQTSFLDCLLIVNWEFEATKKYSKMSLPVYVLEGDFVKDPNIEGEEAQIRKLGCFHSIDCLLYVVLASS